MTLPELKQRDQDEHVLQHRIFIDFPSSQLQQTCLSHHLNSNQVSHLQCVSWAARLYLSQHIMFPHLAISYPPGLLSLGHDLEKVGESNASMPDILARAPMSSVLPLAAKQGSQTLQEACLQKDLSCPVILQLAQACSVRPITADIRFS